MLIHRRSLHRALASTSLALALMAAACAPAAPPAPTAAPARPTAAATKPAAVASPAVAASPVAAKPVASPAAAASPAARPAASPAASPAAKPAAAASPSPAAAASAPLTAAERQSVESFYRGKTVRIIVGQGAGGGFDAFSRRLAQFIPRYIPGTPTVIVENQPAAGGLVAFNQAYNTDPKDGTTFTMSVGSLVAQQLFGNPAVTFDATKFNWLGAQTRDTPACIVNSSSPITSIEQARTQRLILGGTARGSTADDVPNVLKAAGGLNIQLVSGYAGTAAVKLAMENGEVEGSCFTWEGIRVTWREALAANQVRVIAQGGRTPHPELPNVPLMRNLAQNEEQRQLIDAVMDLSRYTRVYTLPPGVPDERVRAMRLAFDQALRDPEMVAIAQSTNLALDPVPGSEVQQFVQGLLTLPSEQVNRLKAALLP